MEIGKKIGSGAYSEVFEMTLGRRKYAFKRCYKPEEVDFCSAAREIDIMCRLQKHPQIIRTVTFTEVSQVDPRPETDQEYNTPDSLNFILELGDCDLFAFIKQAPLSVYRNVVDKICFDILMGLDYIHRRKIIHRDLKPQNLILFTDGEVRVKLADFGLSKVHSNYGQNSPKACTINYRAPEIAKKVQYDMISDIWSAGLIFYDLLRKEPRGLGPGLRKNKQLLAAIEQFEQTELMNIHNIPNGQLLIDLIEKMTQTDPTKRPTALECLSHPYFSKYRNLIHDNDFYPVRSSIVDYIAVDGREIIKELILDQEGSAKQLKDMFQAAIFLDRYLIGVDKGKIKEVPILLAYYTFCYLVVKYTNVMGAIATFREFCPEPIDDQQFEQAETLERQFLAFCEGKFYFDNVLDYLVDPSPKLCKKIINEYFTNRDWRGRCHQTISKYYLPDESK